MDQRPTIPTVRLVLRPFAAEDATLVQALAGAREVAATTASIPHPYPDGAAEAWIGGHATAFARQESLTLAVAGADGLVGAVNLRLEPRHERAELGYWIGRPWWGQGYATEAARAMVGFGFEQLGLRRIHATHFARNPASGRVLQKAGMVFEGLLRQHLKQGDRFEDLVRYAVLRADYQRARRGAP